MKKIHWVGLVLISLFLGSCTNRSSTDSAIIFSDDFNRADGSLSGSTNWAVVTSSGSFAVKNSMAQATGTTPEAYYNIKVTNPLGVSTKVKIVGGSWNGSEFYLTMLKDALNYTGATASYMCGILGGKLKILNDVTQVTLGTVSLPMTNGSEYVLTMTKNGNTITCAASGSGSDSITYTDTTNTFTDGYFGYVYNDFLGNGNYIFFDDFTIF